MENSFIKITDFDIAVLRKQLETEGKEGSPGTLFAILDACDEPRIPEKAYLSGDNAVSLYQGDAQAACRSFAPYLFLVDLELFDWIVGNYLNRGGRCEPWGVFLLADTGSNDMEQLRTHFQQFISVLDPDGEEVYFRFYDPRVLPDYLSLCTREEVDIFFSPVRCFYLYDMQGRVFSIRRGDA